VRSAFRSPQSADQSSPAGDRVALGATSATLPHRQRLTLARVAAPRVARRRRAAPTSVARRRVAAAPARPRADGEFRAIVRATERLWRRAHLTYDQAVEVGKRVRQQLELARPVVRRGAPPRLTPAEASRLITAAYRSASARGGDSRARGLLVKTLLLTGTRVNEFVHLRAEDLDVEQARIRIRNGKGGKARTVPILPELAQELRTHLGKRRAGWLFESRAAGRYSTRRVQQIVHAVALLARIEHRVYPHLLRHTVAQHLLDRGMPIDQVRAFLGHDDIKTTQIYAEATLGAVSESYRRALTGGLSVLEGAEPTTPLRLPRGAGVGPVGTRDGRGRPPVKEARPAPRRRAAPRPARTRRVARGRSS
jgi:integrase/recombinase XerD